MTITVDLSGVEAWKGGGGVLPRGWHLCQIESADDSQNSRNGFDQWIIEWSAIDGEHAGLGITEWLVVTPQSFGKYKAFLDAVGIDTSGGMVSTSASDLYRRRAMVYVGEEADRNDATKLRSRIKAHDRPAGVTPSPPGVPQSTIPDQDIPF